MHQLATLGEPGQRHAHQGLGLVRVAREVAQYIRHVLASHRIESVHRLVEDHELDLLGVRQLRAEVLARQMRWYHLPIVDVQPTD